MVRKQLLKNFRRATCSLNSNFQYDSVFALRIHDMFADGLNSEGMIHRVDIDESSILDPFRRQRSIYNTGIAIHDNLITLLPSSLPHYYDMDIIELDSKLIEIRSIIELHNHKAINQFIEDNTLTHLKFWIR